LFNAKMAVLATAVLGLSFQLMAAETTDTYQATYFYNLGTGPWDASVSILDPGVNAPASICANIYVLNPSEELEACCSVPLTPDEVIQGQLSSLVANLLNNNGLVNGVVKIISSSAGAGAGACPSGSATITPIADLRAWITRVDSVVPFNTHSGNSIRSGDGMGVTTTAFATAPLSTAEEATLVNTCHFIYLYGSGFGQCPGPVEPISGSTPPNP